MNTTFKMINPRNKLGVSNQSRQDYKWTNYNHNNYLKPQHSRKDSPIRENKYYLLPWWEWGQKSFQCKHRTQKDFCQNIPTYFKGQAYFLTLGYDIVSDKNYLLVDCGATEHFINNKSKFIKFDQNIEPGNNFVELGDGSRANNIVLKIGNACIYLRSSKEQMCRWILKNASYIPTFNKWQ